MKRFIAICMLLCSMVSLVACAGIVVSTPSAKTDSSTATNAPTEQLTTLLTTIPTTDRVTEPTTIASGENDDEETTQPTIIMPTEPSTLPPVDATTVPTIKEPTTRPTEKTTTTATTKATTKKTTKPTTKATTKATTKVTTNPTTKFTTMHTTKPTTKACMSHAEYMNAALYDEVTVQFYVQGTQEWWDNTIIVYGQDKAGGGYYIYDMACSKEDAAKLVPGTQIRVVGEKSDWQGLVEIINGTFEFVNGDTWVAPVTDVTDLLGTDDLKTEMNKYVSIKGMTVTAVTFRGDTPGDDIYVKLRYNGVDYTFVVERYLTGPDTQVYATVSGLQAGQVIDIEGMLSWWNGPYVHITSVTVCSSQENEDPAAIKPGYYIGTVDIPNTYAQMYVWSDKTFLLYSNFQLDEIRKVDSYSLNGTYEISGGYIWLYVDGEVHWMYWLGNTGDFFHDQCVSFNYAGVYHSYGGPMADHKANAIAEGLIHRYDYYKKFGICCDIEDTPGDMSQYLSYEQKQNYAYYQYLIPCCNSIEEVFAHMYSFIDSSLITKDPTDYLFFDDVGNMYLMVTPMGVEGYIRVEVESYTENQIIARGYVGYDSLDIYAYDRFAMEQVSGEFVIRSVTRIPI